MLTDVPDYAERCQFLETLKNRLEALVASQVIRAFEDQSLSNTLYIFKFNLLRDFCTTTF